MFIIGGMLCTSFREICSNLSLFLGFHYYWYTIDEELVMDSIQILELETKQRKFELKWVEMHLNHQNLIQMLEKQE